MKLGTNPETTRLDAGANEPHRRVRETDLFRRTFAVSDAIDYLPLDVPREPTPRSRACPAKGGSKVGFVADR
jgi:hypothetical protein